MEELHRDAESLFSLPVASFFENGSNTKEQSEFGYGPTAATATNASLSQSAHAWKKEEVIMSGFQRQEKVGDVIKRELKWAFILHTYGFGCLFFILAFYTFFSILNIRSFISNKPFMSTINGFLCLLGTSRAASLFIDPYSLKENMPKLFGQVLWDLGFPSIISAFCLVQLAFLQFTQLQIGPEGLRRKSCLSLIVTAHFLLTIGMDILAASHENLLIVKHVVHYIFLTWGVFLCSNFLYSGYKIMSMIKSIPEGLKHRDLPDAGYKGIMQLAILAPHNNLAGSMTAALLPALCAPKIHQQDNTNFSTVGFRNDGNSRILESESIPMLEEMAASSGDEISAKPLVRGSSFQNQTRNSQKFNLKPKLSLKSVSDESKDEGCPRVNDSEIKSAKRAAQKPATVKANDFEMASKPNAGILKYAGNPFTAKCNHEFGNKYKNCIENENFSFAGESKSKRDPDSNPEFETSGVGNEIPEILVSGPGDLEPKEKKNVQKEKNQKTLNKLMNEISQDLSEMQILREEKTGKSEKATEIHISKNPNGFEGERERESKKIERLPSEKICPCRIECNGENWRNVSRKGNIYSCREAGAPGGETESSCSTFTEATKLKPAEVGQQRFRGRKKGKCLSWKKKKEEEDEEEKATQECPLLQENSAETTLRSVLNHIAYVNRGISVNVNGEDVENVRKSNVEWVLNLTYITAMWGLMLCLSNMGKIYSPFGVPEPRGTIPHSNSNSTLPQVAAPTESGERGLLYSSWPWLWFQTFCRALELAMGCAMANITRQPTADRRYPRTPGFRNRDTFYGI